MKSQLPTRPTRTKKTKCAQAAYRDMWLGSDEGLACTQSPAEGQYLRNRLDRAYMAGWDAAVRHLILCEQGDVAKRITRQSRE